MTKISDGFVGYPRIYADPIKFDMHSIFFTPDSPGFWLNDFGALVSACVDSEEMMPTKWPEERLIADPAEAKQYLQPLISCHVGAGGLERQITKLDANWRCSWMDLS